MDPVANLIEQRELAVKILSEDWDDRPVALGQHAIRLAELVQVLDEWRVAGGFDPYSGADLSAARAVVTMWDEGMYLPSDYTRPRMDALRAVCT